VVDRIGEPGAGISSCRWNRGSRQLEGQINNICRGCWRTACFVNITDQVLVGENQRRPGRWCGIWRSAEAGNRTVLAWAVQPLGCAPRVTHAGPVASSRPRGKADQAGVAHRRSPTLRAKRSGRAGRWAGCWLGPPRYHPPPPAPTPQKWLRHGESRSARGSGRFTGVSRCCRGEGSLKRPRPPGWGRHNSGPSHEGPLPADLARGWSQYTGPRVAAGTARPGARTGGEQGWLRQGVMSAWGPTVGGHRWGWALWSAITQNLRFGRLRGSRCQPGPIDRLLARVT